ncbi:hypothetical protein B566_EDAN007295 [Ephemera danica]|nr:hypothetical protein B566_EDAN007295 [Ephemera danica]
MQEEMVSHFESLHPEEVHQCTVCDEKICGPVQMKGKHMELHRALEEGQTDELLSNLGVPSVNTNIFDPEFVVIPLGNCPSKFPMYPKSAETLQSKFVSAIKRNVWVKPDMKYRISHSLKLFISKIQLCKRVRKPKPKVEIVECSVSSEILKNYLESRLKSQDIPEKIECSHCNQSYIISDESTHIESHHNGGKKLMCKICDSKFNISGENQPHMIPKSDFPFGCSVKSCRNAYLTEANLEKHRQTRHISNPDSSPCLCELCGKVYSDKCGLRYHFRHAHLPNKGTVFTCNLCDVRYSRKSSLKRHKIAVHEPKVTCRVCGKLLTRIAIHRHMKIHDDASKFPCKYCGKLYTTKANCTVHEQSRHEGVKIRCTICKDLNFKSVKGMEEHRLKHERGEEIILPPYLRPVKCSICSRNFPNSVRLKEHLRMHNKPKNNKRKMSSVNNHNTRETTFPCVPCLLRFLTQECYDKHIKTHHPDGVPVTTSKPRSLEFRYPCRYCEKSFGKKYGCDDHESSVHGSGKRHACEFCGHQFSYHASKWAHQQKCMIECAVGPS